MSFIHVSKGGRFYELCSYNSGRDVSSLLSSDTSVNTISHYRKENWPALSVAIVQRHSAVCMKLLEWER